MTLLQPIPTINNSWRKEEPSYIQLASAFRNLGSMTTSINNSTESKKMLRVL